MLVIVHLLQLKLKTVNLSLKLPYRLSLRYGYIKMNLKRLILIFIYNFYKKAIEQNENKGLVKVTLNDTRILEQINRSKRSNLSNKKLSFNQKKILNKNFYQFGPTNGDLAVSKSYDSVLINTKVSFLFNNEFFSKIYLNKYACLSLGNPNLLNGNNEIPIISPFYLNINLMIGGDIYYRQVTNSFDLIEIKQDINLIDPSFNPTWALIITWYQVTINGVHTNLHNTFQAVLTTSGTKSFIIFHYGKLKVSSSESFAGYQSDKYYNSYCERITKFK